MATEQNVIELRATAVAKAKTRANEKRFYLAAGIIFLLFTVIGFSKTYYLRPFLPDIQPLYSDLLRVHAALMTIWVLLFAAQVSLISAKKVRLHMKLGWAGVVLAVLIVATGYPTAIAATRRLNGTVDIGGMDQLSFLIIPLGDLLMYVILFGAAIVLRKRPADHKRLMLLSAINFLPPAAARMPVDFLQAMGPLWLFGMPVVLTITLLAYDTWKQRKLNLAFFAGAILFIAGLVVRLMLAPTEGWRSIARWLTGIY